MTIEPWHADINITEELVTCCLQDQFPDLMPIKEIKFIGEGWDNKVYLINGKTIFRFPRRKTSVELIERENKVLKNLQAINLGLEIPNPNYIGLSTSYYPYPFHGYEMIEGISGCHAQLNDQERILTLKTLANFLKLLHSINEKKAANMGALPQVFDKMNMDTTIKALSERVEKINSLKIIVINEYHFQNEIITAKNIKLPAAKCLVHGDLYCRHLLFNKGQLTGIIDWGDMGINNRSVDLSVIWSFYPSSCQQDFFKIYGEIDSATWQLARFFGLYIALTVILYSYDIKDNLLLVEAINTVKRINTKLLI